MIKLSKPKLHLALNLAKSQLGHMVLSSSEEKGVFNNKLFFQLHQHETKISSQLMDALLHDLVHHGLVEDSTKTMWAEFKDNAFVIWCVR